MLVVVAVEIVPIAEAVVVVAAVIIAATVVLVIRRGAAVADLLSNVNLADLTFLLIFSVHVRKDCFLFVFMIFFYADDSALG